MLLLARPILDDRWLAEIGLHLLAENSGKMSAAGLAESMTILIDGRERLAPRRRH